MIANARRWVVKAIIILVASPIAAEQYVCPGSRVLTENAGDAGPWICSVSTRATEQLASCGLVVPAPVTISVSEELPDRCLALYHCGHGRIEILAPEAYSKVRSGGGAPAFAAVSDDAFFESIVRHELAHAALEGMPCPFDSCDVGQEYVAYAMQVRFLPDIERTAFEEAMPHQGPVSRHTLNKMVLAMAPDVFARRAWIHFKNQEDPCALIGEIARGAVSLDFEQF